MLFYNYKYTNLVVRSYIQNFLHFFSNNQCFLKRMSLTFEFRFRNSKIYVFLVVYSYVQNLFVGNNVKVLFNKKKTKNKYRRLTYKEITLHFTIMKAQTFYNFSSIINIIAVDNYIDNSRLYHNLPFKINYFLKNNKSLFYFNSASYGISFNLLLNILRPYIILPIEVKTILKSLVNKSYLKLHISSDYDDYQYDSFFTHNIFPKYRYPFLIYND